MWWEWVVRGYIVLWTAGMLFLGVVLFCHTLKQGITPLAEVFLPLAVLFWFGCWRAFLFHRWAVIAVCILGWFLTLLLSAHTTLPTSWDDPKDREPFHHVVLQYLVAIGLFLIYWVSVGLFSAAVVYGWKQWEGGF